MHALVIIHISVVMRYCYLKIKGNWAVIYEFYRTELRYHYLP